MSSDQKQQLSFDDFINDGREIPDELPASIEPEVTLTAEDIRHEARLKYWTYALPIIREAQGGEGHPYGNVNPTESSSKDGFFGIGGIHLYCSVGMKKPIHCNTGLWIDTGNKETSKILFDLLFAHKEEIDAKVSMPLSWDRKDDHIASSIDFVFDGADFTDQEQWPEISAFHAKMSKELADYVFYPYEQEIRELDFIANSNPNNNDYYSDIFKSWATRMTEAGSISVDLDKCTKTYTRFKTPIMSMLLPDAAEPLSGWKTKNHYFYEIRNTAGIFIQFAVSSENISDSLREMCDRINEHYRSRRNKTDWQWRISFTTSKFKYDKEPSEEEICSHLDGMLEEIKEFELALCEKLGIQLPE